MSRRLAVLFASGLTLLAVLGPASPAAAISTNRKLAVLSSWTQTTATSYNRWNAARLDQTAWARYNFDWSTDYCSNSPDNPLGFDFRLSCYRHDFGHRNYRDLGLLAANKPRLDSAFYEDMKRACLTYSSWVQPACYSLAWTYYEAVSSVGTLTVSQADLDHAAKLKADGERRMAAADAR